MRAVFSLIILTAAILPQPAAAQELDVTRQRYNFVDNRLDVAVLAEAPGVLQVVRGGRGLLEVAARSRDGFAGFALGGNLTRELRLTAVGAESVQYLVVVPERVSVRILLPGGQRLSLSPLAAAGTWEWGSPAASGAGAAGTAPAPGAAATAPAPGATGAAPAMAPAQLTGTPGEEAGADGFFVAHRDRWAPGVVDLPDLGAVRSLSVRFDGGEFRVAASRPLAVMPGSRNHMELRLDGDPLDVVIYVPRGRADFVIRSGAQTLARSAGDQPAAVCSNVVIQTPSAEQSWFTFYPQAGRLDCR